MGLTRLLHKRLLAVAGDDDAENVDWEVEGETENEHMLIGFDGMMISFVLILLVVTACAAEKLKLPASSAAIIIGAAFGACFRLLGAQTSDRVHNEALILFDEELFLYVLLPPIIFEAGFSLPKRHFFDNLGTILLFAVVGTLASTFVIGQSLYMAGHRNAFSSSSGRADALDFTTPLDSYLFGALISATDPVATLSIMGAVNADPVVYTLIFGESVLNDAVAIVLVRILESMGRVGFANPLAYLSGVAQFFAVSLGSLLVGIVVSAASAMLLVRFDMTHHASFEVALILLFGYAAYSTAEAVGGSGILALFTTGVLCGHYHVQSLSAEARAASGVVLKALAHLAETSVFAYMGVDLFAITGAGVDAFAGAHEAFNTSAAIHAAGEMAAAAAADGGDETAAAAAAAAAAGGGETAAAAAAAAAAGEEPESERAAIGFFVLFALAVVLLARVVVMLPLCLFANTFRGARRVLSRRATAMLVFAGLRGAIAFALAHNVHSNHQPAIAAATTTVVLVTVFVLGGATRTVLKLLRMEAPPEGPQARLQGLGGMRSDESDAASDGTGGTQGGSAAAEEAQRSGGVGGASWRVLAWERLDDRYLRPLFVGGGRARIVGESHHAAPAMPDDSGIELETADPSTGTLEREAAGGAAGGGAAGGLARAREDERGGAAAAAAGENVDAGRVR